MAREQQEIVDRRRALGARLAVFRQAANLTQGQLAAQVFVDRTTIAHMERGQHRGTPQLWQAIDTAVAAEGALLASHTALTTEAATRAAHAHSETLAAIRAQADTLRTQGDEQIASSVQLGFTSFTGFAQGGDGGVAEPPSITVIRAMSESFQLADRRLGGGLLYAQVVRYIRAEIAPALLDPPHGTPAPDLFSAAASFAEFAGWMAHDSGRNQKARAHFGHAYHLAAAASNPALSANVCASLAHLAIQLGKSDDAIRIATAGLPWATQAQHTDHLVARLHAMRARAFAQQGDDLECRRSLAAAQHALSDSHDSSAAGWIAGFDQASLAAEAALCLYTLGALAEAETEARTVISVRNGDRIRSRALGQLTLARILYRAGRAEEAAMIGAEVCAVAPTLNSARVHGGLTALGKTLSQGRSTPEVRSFLASVESLHQRQAVPRADERWPL